MRRVISWLCIFLVLFTLGCEKGGENGYTIAVDPSFFPLDIEGREENVYVFLNDLLHEVGEKSGVTLNKTNVAWDMVLSRVEEGKVDGAISSIEPYAHNKAMYDFSELLLQTGPVLVVRERSNITSFQNFGKGILLVANVDQEQVILREYPEILPKTYDQLAPALEKVLNGYADGILLDAVDAPAYTQVRFAGRLRSAGPPLGNGGLRIITKKGAHPDLIQRVNTGIEAVKASGMYKTLLKKWGI